MDPVWQGVRNLMVARLDNIGDVVMLSPALRSIKENLPLAKVTLFASPAGASAACLSEAIDDVLEWRVVWQDVGGRIPFDSAREQRMIDVLRGRGFDAAIIFTSFSQTPYGVAYACYLAGIPVRLGQSKEFGGSLLTQEVRSPSDGLHQAERNLRMLEAAGFKVTSRDLRVCIPDDAKLSSAAKLNDHGVTGNHYVVIQPAASCSARSYDLTRLAAAADGVIGELGLPVVIVGAERERALVEQMTGKMHRHAVSLAGQTTVPEWAALIARAQLVITNNSGSMHLADACRTPSVVLYSGSDLVTQWLPRDSPTWILRRSTHCTPCYRFSCPYKMECLDIPPSDVVAAARALLAQTGGAQRAVGAA